MKEGAEIIGKLREDVNTLQDDYVAGRKREAALVIEIKEGAEHNHNAFHWFRKREDAYMKEIKEGAEFRKKLREDVNALKDEYDAGHKQEDIILTQMKEGAEIIGTWREDIRTLQGDFVELEKLRGDIKKSAESITAETDRPMT